MSMRTILLSGPPGSGKTLRARKLHAELLQPAGLLADQIEVIYKEVFREERKDFPSTPFRSPLYTVSEAGLCGTIDRYGELHLAHGGTLFLDEATEFRKGSLAALADKLHARHYSPRLLILAADRCACGYLGSPHPDPCKCSKEQISTYSLRLAAICGLLHIQEVELLSSRQTAAR